MQWTGLELNLLFSRCPERSPLNRAYGWNARRRIFCGRCGCPTGRWGRPRTDDTSCLSLWGRGSSDDLGTGPGWMVSSFSCDTLASTVADRVWANQARMESGWVSGAGARRAQTADKSLVIERSLRASGRRRFKASGRQGIRASQRRPCHVARVPSPHHATGPSSIPTHSRPRAGRPAGHGWSAELISGRKSLRTKLEPNTRKGS